MEKACRDNRGFTLVELIVVITILAILAAIMVPTAMSYIDKAKNQQLIIEMKELMNATQAGIIDAYAYEKTDFLKTVRNDKYNVLPNAKEYGYFTNAWVTRAMKGEAFKPEEINADGGKAKIRICNRIKEYVDGEGYDLVDNLSNAQTVASLNGKQAFVVMYSKNGAILYMQYAKKGMLVTYDGSSYSVQEGGSFKSFRN